MQTQIKILIDPSKQNRRILYRTNTSLAKIIFTTDNIANIIKNLDSNKFHGDNNVSVRMLNLCDASIYKPFRTYLNNCKFPEVWKKANVVAKLKKCHKQCVINDLPVSLQPICSKIFVRNIYNNRYNYLIDNKLISQNRSGFTRVESCINQLISITHDILHSLDDGFEVRGVFQDISKVLDKVWYEGMIYELQRNGTSGEILHILISFLNNRKERLVLNGQSSNWTEDKAGVLQGLIMGLLLFLIYITEGFCFADDTSLFSIVQDIAGSTEELSNDLSMTHQYLTLI